MLDPWLPIEPCQTLWLGAQADPSLPLAHMPTCTNAYKLQPSLSERVIVDGHGCHTALHFGVKARENQDKVPTLSWLPKLHKKPYKARLMANSSSCTTTELSKLLISCLTAVKNMLSSIVNRYMRDPVKTYFGLLKIQVTFKINLKLEISMRPVCLLMIFLLFTLLYLII